jgi:alkylation response protein AidB-like acyl-CoA dehydrogenase
MSDDAASLPGRHMNGENGRIFTEARSRLISWGVGHAWTSGQWMAERRGGSDVQGTETVARKARGTDDEDLVALDAAGMKLGPWTIDGFKWFSSATDADMAILLAKSGTAGQISAFYAPLKRRKMDGAGGDTEFNGIKI